MESRKSDRPRGAYGSTQGESGGAGRYPLDAATLTDAGPARAEGPGGRVPTRPGHGADPVEPRVAELYIRATECPS